MFKLNVLLALWGLVSLSGQRSLAATMNSAQNALIKAESMAATAAQGSDLDKAAQLNRVAYDGVSTAGLSVAVPVGASTARRGTRLGADAKAARTSLGPNVPSPRAEKVSSDGAGTGARVGARVGFVGGFMAVMLPATVLYAIPVIGHVLGHFADVVLFIPAVVVGAVAGILGALVGAGIGAVAD